MRSVSSLFVVAGAAVGPHGGRPRSAVHSIKSRHAVCPVPGATKYQCPKCEAEYKVVRVEAPPTHDNPLLCLSCGGPLQNRDGKFALAYFRMMDQGRPVRIIASRDCADHGTQQLAISALVYSDDRATDARLVITASLSCHKSVNRGVIPAPSRPVEFRERLPLARIQLRRSRVSG